MAFQHCSVSRLSVVVIFLLACLEAFASSLAAGGHSSASFNALPARATTPTDVCKRWSQQSAIVNGTIYLYGGRATMSAEQSANEWNNDFLTLDLTKTWQISTPSLAGLSRPSGPPPVANGYLWASYDSFYLYGGEFSDNPITSPVPFALWKYQIDSGQWIEQSNPITSTGQNAPDGNAPVVRAAEGAGFSVAALGRGWYFGGHEDEYTMDGWTYRNGRVYLTSLLEYTFPGYPNQQVDTLSSGTTAGTDGVWRNITQGALDDDAGFPERADGVLVWVPGFGDQGILLGLAGGTNDSFTQTNIIDIYDVARSSWYKQATSGPMPEPRVNPCAVVAAAADGSSYNVYMYGGQDLLPAGHQTQYSDMWILSIPTFTWIRVDQSGQSVPPARAGHTCNIWDAQMVVVGGYVGDTLSCDSPGIYVYDMSNLEWTNQFTSKSSMTHNPQAKQDTQMADPLALQGSYAYAVPAAVQSVIGGGPSGGATATVPAATATSGPIATGKPHTYKLPPGTSGLTGSGSGSSSHGTPPAGSSTNVGAIVAGAVAGILFIVLLYLAFVAWLYRKRLAQYKRNVDTLGWNPAKAARGRYEALYPGSDARSSSPDSLSGREPTFVGIMLSPRRSLRITNPDPD